MSESRWFRLLKDGQENIPNDSARIAIGSGCFTAKYADDRFGGMDGADREAGNLHTHPGCNMNCRLCGTKHIGPCPPKGQIAGGGAAATPRVLPAGGRLPGTPAAGANAAQSKTLEAIRARQQRLELDASARAGIADLQPAALQPVGHDQIFAKVAPGMMVRAGMSRETGLPHARRDFRQMISVDANANRGMHVLVPSGPEYGVAIVRSGLGNHLSSKRYTGCKGFAAKFTVDRSEFLALAHVNPQIDLSLPLMYLFRFIADIRFPGKTCANELDMRTALMDVLKTSTFFLIGDKTRFVKIRDSRGNRYVAGSPSSQHIVQALVSLDAGVKGWIPRDGFEAVSISLDDTVITFEANVHSVTQPERSIGWDGNER